MKQLHSLSISIGSKVCSITVLKVTTCLFVSTVLFGCQPRVNLDDTKPEVPEEEVVDETAVTFSADLRRPETRAGITEDDLLASNKLISAKDMRIVFYSLNEGGKPDKVAYAFDREFLIYRGKATGEDLESFNFDDRKLKLKGKELLPIGDYAVIYFTTPSKAIKAATELGKEYGELMKAVSIEDITENGVLRYSIYSNIENPLMVTKEEMQEAGAIDAFEIKPSDLKALNGLVYVTAEANIEDEAYYIPKDRTIFLRATVTNKTLIPHPVYAKVMLKDGNEAKIPEDKNYDTTSLSESGLKEEFFYHETESTFEHNYNYIKFDGSTVDKAGADWAMPLQENTVSHLSLTSKTVTQLLLCVPVYPVSLLEEIGETDKDISEQSWLRVAGKDYLEDPFMAKYTAAAAIDEEDRNEEEQAIVEAGRELAKLNPQYKTPKEGDEPAVFTPDYSYHGTKVDFRHWGFSYYSVPIRHYENAVQPDPGKDGRYGVVRNTLYYYHITGFTTIGATEFADLDRTTRHYDEETEAGLGTPTFTTPDYIGRTIHP